MPLGLSVFCMNVFVNYARGKKHESYSLLKVMLFLKGNLTQFSSHEENSACKISCIMSSLTEGSLWSLRKKMSSWCHQGYLSQMRSRYWLHYGKCMILFLKVKSYLGLKVYLSLTSSILSPTDRSARTELILAYYR